MMDSLTVKANTYRLNVWFPGLHDEPPARVEWIAGSAELALARVEEQFPECKVELKD